MKKIKNATTLARRARDFKSELISLFSPGIA
jgi:hypothetical protein